MLPALLPSLLTLGFAAVLWRGVPGDFTPLWSDEVLYWNEAAAFLRAGFHAGYITVAEVAAPAAFSHFGPHGVGYAMLYGLVGRLIGWHANTQYLLHLLVIPLCAGAWFWVRRHQPGRLAVALLHPDGHDRAPAVRYRVPVCGSAREPGAESGQYGRTGGAC